MPTGLPVNKCVKRTYETMPVSYATGAGPTAQTTSRGTLGLGLPWPAELALLPRAMGRRTQRSFDNDRRRHNVLFLDTGLAPPRKKLRHRHKHLLGTTETCESGKVQGPGWRTRAARHVPMPLVQLSAAHYAGPTCCTYKDLQLEA